MTFSFGKPDVRIGGPGDEPAAPSSGTPFHVLLIGDFTGRASRGVQAPLRGRRSVQVDRDTLESAVVDGASRFERLRLVVIPHLKPLIVFVALIHLMDSYRVFDEVVGFSAQAHRISLQWLTFSLLTPDETGNRAIARASASSMLTMIGIVLLLVPLLIGAWRDHRTAR